MNVEIPMEIHSDENSASFMYLIAIYLSTFRTPFSDRPLSAP